MRTTAAILLTTLIALQASSATADAGNFHYFREDGAGRVDVSKCIKAAKKGVVLQQQRRKDGVIRNMYLLKDAMYLLRVDHYSHTKGREKRVACHEYLFVEAKSKYLDLQ